MSFDNSHNHKRVQRILIDLTLIENSARSNRADPEDLRAMLTPVFDHLKEMGFANTVRAVEMPTATEAVEGPSGGHVGVTAPPWASVIDMARQASLQDLTRAMAVYLDRIDEELGK